MKTTYRILIILGLIFLLDGLVDILFYMYSYGSYISSADEMFKKILNESGLQMIARTSIFLLGLIIWIFDEKKKNQILELKKEKQNFDMLKKTINTITIPTLIINENGEIFASNHSWLKTILDLELNKKINSLNNNFKEILKALTSCDENLTKDYLDNSHLVLKGSTSYYSFEFSIDSHSNINWYKARFNHVNLFNKNWVFFSIENIITKKEIELAQKETAESILFNGIMNSNNPIVVINNGIIEFSNDEFNQAMNMTADSIIGKDLYDFVNESDKVKYQNLLTSKIPKDDEIRLISNNFEPFIGLTRSWNFNFSGVKKNILSFVDRTKLTILEAEMESVNLQIDEFFERSCVSILIVDDQLKIIRINELASALIEFDYNEAIQSLSLFDIIEQKYQNDISAIINNQTDVSMLELNIVSKRNLLKRTICSFFRLPNSENYAALFIDLSSYDRSMQAVVNKERILRELAENMDDMVWLRDVKSGKLLYISSNANSKWSIKAATNAELVSSIYARTFPEDIHLVSEAMKNIEDSSKMLDEQFRFEINGEFRWIWMRTSPIYGLGANPELVRIVGVAQDITERKAIEMNLLNQQQSYREIFNSANDGIFIHDYETGEVIDANEYAYKIIHETNLETLKKTWKCDLSGAENIFTEKEAVSKIKLASFGEQQVFEWKVKTEKGKIKWVEINLKLAIIEGKKRVIAIVREIGDRKRIENLLRDREEFLTDVFSSIANPLFVVNVIDKGHDFIISELNSEVEKVFNSTREELLNNSFSELSSSVNNIITNSFLIKIQESFKTKSRIIWEHSLDINGEISYWLTSFTPIKRKDNSIEQIISASTSITLQKQAEEQIINLNLDLENKIKIRTKELETTLQELNFEMASRRKIEEELLISQKELLGALENEKHLSEMKTRFISMMSHEYRTPLTIILTSAMLLEKFYQTKDDTMFAKYIKNMQSTINDMIKTLENVLSAGRYDNESLKANYDLININELFTKTINEAKTLDKSTHIIKSEIENIRIRSDYSLLKASALNLLLNAQKYSPEGSEIFVSARIVNKEFVISISDKGIGINEDERDRIFEQFYRGSKVLNTNIAGTGLGLSITKSCVNALEGKIEFQSELGKGTTFIIKLPLKEN